MPKRIIKKIRGKYPNLFDAFYLGKKIAEERVRLANKYDNDFVGQEEDIKNYLFLRTEWDKIGVYELKKNGISLLGYSAGYLNSFCWAKSTLTEFDETIRNLIKPAREGL